MRRVSRFFCGKDVCEVLRYAQADKAIVRHVMDLDRMKRTVKVPGGLRKDGSRTARRQQMLFVNESGFTASYSARSCR